MMTWDEYQDSRKFIETKMLALMLIENKPFARLGFPEKNYKEYNHGDRRFFYVSTNIFDGIMEDVLITAAKNLPDRFGTGHAINVISALNTIRPLYKRIKDVIRILRKETFALIIENTNGIIHEKILRLDLFRKLDPNNKNRRQCDFTGGVFHALKHFSYEGNPLSTGKEINDLNDPTQIIELIIDAFFVGEEGYYKSPEEYICFLSLSQTTDLRMAFYFEKKSGVYFLNTIHMQDRRSTDKQKIKASPSI